jgi:hypothetical protein
MNCDKSLKTSKTVKNTGQFHDGINSNKSTSKTHKTFRIVVGLYGWKTRSLAVAEKLKYKFKGLNTWNESN